MKHDPNNLVLFLGHFHPLLVHLPIGGLVLLGFLELVAGVTRWKEAAHNRRWILGFVFVAACVSSACGWMLAQGGGYAPCLLKWHRAAGMVLTGACLLLSLMVHRERAYQVSLAITLLLLGIVSHLGGSMTYGSDFLTRFAPVPVRAFLDRLSVAGPKTHVTPFSNQQAAYTRLIQPILQEHCAACHGAGKRKANLRLDNLDGVLRGGRDGPVIKAGQARESLLIQRILLPLDANGHMPPEDEPQLRPEEITLLEWWVDAGAPAFKTADGLPSQADLPRVPEPLPGRTNSGQ